MTPYAAPTVTQDRRILCFGDSFVAGVGDPTGLGWVGRVVAASYAAGHPITAYNLGVRRDASSDVAARWRTEADARLGVADARFGVVFSFGTNDATEEDGALRVAADRSVGNLARMIDEAHTLELDVFVVGPPPVGEPAHDERVRELSAAFAIVASERDVAYVDALTPLSATPEWTIDAAANDGAHPGAGGYAALARLVLESGWIAWLR